MNLYGGINSQDDSENENHWKKTVLSYIRYIYLIYIYVYVSYMYIRYIYYIYML